MQSVQLCENCRKPFPQSKINSHFAYCRRNIKKCQHCDQMIDINHLEEHMEDQHAKSTCDHCGVSVNAKELNQHLKKCVSKPVVCAFCQQSVPVISFDDHQQHCGSRTKVCLKCDRSIVLREYDMHEATCEGMPTPAAAKAYTNYNDYIKKQRDQLGMAQKEPLRAPPKPIQVQKIRIGATTNSPTKPGESAVYKHQLKQLQPRVVEVKAPRLINGTEQQRNQPIRRVVSTRVTTINPYDGTPTVVTYEGDYRNQIYAQSQPRVVKEVIRPTVTRANTYGGFEGADFGFEDEDVQLQRALQESLRNH